jgi:hypothetical protein
MEYSLKDIWRDFRSSEYAVHIDTDTYESSIIKGVKMVNDGETIQILCTSSDMYREVSDELYNVFLTEGVEQGVKAYRLDRYNKQLLDPMYTSRARENIKRKMKKL